MEIFSENKYYKLYHGNMLDMLEILRGGEVSSIVTDPPYELNFMGKGWDNSGIAFNPDTWKKCLEVLKPGGYLLAFGGSRTYHRIACAIEDAGFEIRDCIMWLYGSGFPKSMNIEKSINKIDGVEFKSKPASGVGFMNTDNDGYHNTMNQLEQVGESSERAKQRAGWGTALKPSYEPIIVARKPLEGSCTDNVIKYGVGGINIDECRVPFEDTKNPATNPLYRKNAGYKLPEKGQDSKGAVSFTSSKNETSDLGRFPANTILTYGDDDKEEVCSGFPNTKGQKTNSPLLDIRGNNYNNAKKNLDIAYERGYNDEGSAARYFYCAKASKRDRDEGLDEFEESNSMCDRNPELKSANMPQNRSGNMRKNTHPTVKPTELMQYLVRLVTPNGGTVLDPFNGSGSTGKAVMYENKDRNKNYKYIGIELTDEYLPIAKARIEYAINAVEEKEHEQKQPTLFDI